MPLPSSGQISIADIRNEAVTGGCYSAGGSYSLGALATALGISTDPDAMSEFYSKSCPTTTTTTTTTSTTTSTTTAVYTVTVSMKQGITPTPDTSAFLYTYTTGTPTYRGLMSNTTCQSFPVSTFTVPAGTTLYFGVIDGDSNDVYFNAAVSSTCPSNAATYCYGGFSQTINANTNIAITAYVAKFGTYVACGGTCLECTLP